MSIRESRFGRLTSHFFAGFLDNDLLVSSEAGMSNLLSQVLGVCAVPGLFYSLLCTMRYGGTPRVMRQIYVMETTSCSSISPWWWPVFWR
jgi:hypothetical protein